MEQCEGMGWRLPRTWAALGPLVGSYCIRVPKERPHRMKINRGERDANAFHMRRISRRVDERAWFWLVSVAVWCV